MKKLFCAAAIIMLTALVTSCSPQPATVDDTPKGAENGPEAPAPTPIDKDVYLDIPGASYSLDSEAIPYAIVNNSGQAVNVQLIPLLAQETAAGWEEIAPVGVGFCGNPDTIESRWEDSLPLSWYADTLTPGHYRLSFQTVSGQKYTPGARLTAEFDITAATNDTAPVWITADNTADASGLNLYWQADNLQFAADENAKLNIYVDAARNAGGQFAFDDGQEWLVLLETSGGDYPLFPREYVQLGGVSCVVFNDAADAFHVLVTIQQTASYRLYDCIFDKEQKAFRVAPVYDVGGINFITASP